MACMFGARRSPIGDSFVCNQARSWSATTSPYLSQDGSTSLCKRDAPMVDVDVEDQKIHRMIHRVFDPADTDIFYHYCSNETFRLICENKTLRFSDVNMLNDYAESRWGYSVFEDAA